MTEDEATTTLDDLAAAWDAAEEPTDVEPPTETSDQFEGVEDDQPESSIGEPEVSAGSGGNETPEEDAGDPVGPNGSGAQDSAGQIAAKDDGGCPVSLPAAAREEWKNTPQAMKDAISKRERDYAVGIQKHAEGAKRAVHMDRALSPFRQYFAMNGNNPPKTMHDLLATAASLQTGAPLQKAQQVANLIHQFGVDVQALDQILVGDTPQQSPQNQNNQAIHQAVQQAVAPYQQHMQQVQAHQQQVHQKEQSQIAGELETFARDPKNEFFRDVRMDMADILDMASNRGLDMSLQEAYRRACALNPEISKVMGGRVQQQSVQRKRRASSSVAGSPGGPGSSQQPADMRGAIEQAWETANRM